MIKKYDKKYYQVMNFNERQLQKYGSNRHRLFQNEIDVATIIEKKKMMALNKKQLKQNMINARKLKIKINSIIEHYFNNLQLCSGIKIRFSNNSQRISYKTLKVQKSQFQSIIVPQPNKHSKSRQNHQQPTIKWKIKSSISLSKLPSNKSRSPTYFQKKQGPTNEKLMKIEQSTAALLSQLKDEQLLQIQEDQSYYLIHKELIQLFHRFMMKRRAFRRDYSLQRFMLNGNTSNKAQQSYPKQGTQQLKSYLSQKLGLKRQVPEPLLTNPIYPIYLNRKIKSQSLASLTSRKNINFQQFKVRQQQNRRRLLQKQQKKVLDLKLDIYYYSDVANYNKQMKRASKLRRISQLNTINTDRSIRYREKICQNRLIYSKSSQISQQLRLIFLKKRRQIQNYRKQAQLNEQRQRSLIKQKQFNDLITNISQYKTYEINK